MVNNMEYNQETLRKLQKTELEILKDFIKICKKYNLTYFATGGTAIGALRHQGFIPWDDDIDVCMLRKDYERFMEVAPKEMGDRYVFMDTHTEKKYPLMFGKMIKKGTRFIEDAYQQADYPLGIFIDIFPYDQTAEEEKIRRKWQKKTWHIARAHVLTLIADPNLPENMNGVLKNVAKVGCKMLHGIFRLIRLTPDKTATAYLKWAKSCPEKDSDLYIDYSYITGENLMIRTQDAFPVIEKPFEDITISMVRNYDAFLRPEYGDYMQLPPKEQQHNHYAHYIDFGE